MGRKRTPPEPPSVEEALRIIKQLTPGEMDRLVDLLEKEHAPFLEMADLRVSRLVKNTDQAVATSRAFIEVRNEAARAIAEVIKAARAKLRSMKRQSSPDTVARNLQICDWRKSDPKKWTFGRLVKHFHIKRQSIQVILKNEKKWRRLAAEQAAN